ncbi:hypothetical protein [Corynebacterium camporealensis]|uniref:AMIN-like domain-containing (lipo)protein n=1 Tax=Corynebacterium camporealensis TaxID=161896 RepID=UPI00389A6B89
MMHVSALRFTTAVLAAAVLSVSCASSADNADPKLSTLDIEAESPAVTPEPTAAGVMPLGAANKEMKTERPPAPAQLVVTDVRVGKHSGFERVVFEFSGNGTPGWFVDYTDTPSQLGSGNAIEFNGNTALNVNIDGTTYPFELDISDPHLGVTEGTGDIITEVIPTGTFEGRSQFVVGLSSAHPYSVQVLRGPSRLVIDILESS